MISNATIEIMSKRLEFFYISPVGVASPVE